MQGIYSMTRTAPMYTPKMKPAVIPYYASKQVNKATPKQIDFLIGIFKAIIDGIALVTWLCAAAGVCCWGCAGCCFCHGYRMNKHEVQDKKDIQLSQI